MKDQLEHKIAVACMALYGIQPKIELTRSDQRFGDFATNVSLQLAQQLQKPPKDIAESLSSKLREELEEVDKIEIAGPGFINLTLKDSALLQAALESVSRSLEGKVIVVEYSDPNPFKILHAGHLYTSIVGDAIANLLSEAGATVHRVNFGGDVGLHVAKAMWSIVQKLGGEIPGKLNDITVGDRAEWLTQAYVLGNNAYEESDESKAEIVEYNKRIYEIHEIGDHDSDFAKIYWTTRQWSYDYFDYFYERIGTKFEKYYPESETAPIGLKTIKSHIGDVYEESNGAVIFNGEKHGLHTRVFINSAGLPTYETKDVGLIMKKWQDYHFDQSIIITANDIIEYMKVVLLSIEQFMPDLPKRTRHLTHGMVKLAGGAKMSSRKGNILRAVDVLEAASSANKKLTGSDDPLTVLGAVKYAFLKSRIGGDIVYDPAESVSIEGDSGPYLQYAHARARSILRNASIQEFLIDGTLDTHERLLLSKLSEYSEVVNKSISELLPHYICTYLYELAQTFNRFYENSRVIGDPRQTTRLSLVNLYADRLKEGLNLLGIDAPERM